MSFTLDPTEPLPDELARVARERLEDARRRLASETGETLDVRVHEARKSTKQTRAVLRLVRDEVGDGCYREQNRRLRDAARLLAPLRDAQVLHTVVYRAEDCVLEPEALARLRTAAAAQLRSEKARAAQARSVQQTAGEVSAVHDSVEDWPLARDRWRVLRPGLQRTYRHGRAGLARAAGGQGDDATVHEWRKRAKDLWYHLRLLSPAWPEALEPLAEQAHRLSDVLGDDHDLAVLVQRSGEPALGLTDQERAALDAWARRRQTPLRGEALALGQRLYAERPKAFTARLAGIWKAARRAPAHEPA